MAVIPLTATQIVSGGVSTAALYTGSLSTGNTYTVPCDGRTFLHFRKTGAGACTVTIVTPITVDSLSVLDRAVTVPATTGDVLVARLTPDVYADPLTGLMTFSCSEVTGLSVGVFRL